MSGKGSARRPGTGYADNFDKIFEDAQEAKRTQKEELIRQCREDGLTEDEIEGIIEERP